MACHSASHSVCAVHTFKQSMEFAIPNTFLQMLHASAMSVAAQFVAGGFESETGNTQCGHAALI